MDGSARAARGGALSVPARLGEHETWCLVKSVNRSLPGGAREVLGLSLQRLGAGVLRQSVDVELETLHSPADRISVLRDEPQRAGLRTVFVDAQELVERFEALVVVVDLHRGWLGSQDLQRPSHARLRRKE